MNELVSKENNHLNNKQWSERTISFFNFFTPLIFLFMKQLMLLVLLTGMVATSAFGQATTGSAPRPLTCTDDPLHPIAGKPYDYSAILNPAGGSTYWYATKSTTFVTAGARVAAEILPSATTIFSPATGNYRTPGAAATSPTKTNVTWASEVLKGVDATNPLFMVLEYKGSGTPSCSNNMKVYQILPKNAFTVDILNLKNTDKSALAYGTTDTQCYADIADAKYDAPTSKMVFDYGTNKLYFEVVAANFTGSFTPSFKLTGLKTGQSALLEWTTDKTLATGLTALGAAQTATTGTALNFTGTAVTPVATVTDMTKGVSIYIMVTVKNGLYEGLTDDAVTLAVEAVNINLEPDIDNATCATPASTFEDTAVQTLNKRPTVTNDPATGAFVVQTLP
jgi:hypothetical protein